MKRTALSLLCVLALCAGLLSGRAAAAGTIYFTAVNDTILPLSAGSMPMVSDGVLYVPYTMFDPNSTGISLGVSCSYSHSGNTLTVYNLRQMLVYDLDAGNARNQHTGYVYSARAVTRNGVVYIPVGFTCDFFGLSWSNTITAYGNLIRVTNSSAVLSDADFIDAGSPWMASRLQEYLQTQNIPDPEPQPSTDPQPTPSDPEPEEPVTGGRIYLAFRCETGESWAQLLDLLDQYGIHALFLLPADLMAEQDSLIRRTVGSGHSVGLLVRGEDPADAAVLYGRLHAAAGTLLPLLRRAVRVREEDVSIALDFEKAATEVRGEIGLRTRVIHLLGLALGAALGAAGWYFGYRKLASEPEDRGGEAKAESRAPAA